MHETYHALNGTGVFPYQVRGTHNNLIPDQKVTDLSDTGETTFRYNTLNDLPLTTARAGVDDGDLD